jgi:hypothetical protein
LCRESNGEQEISVLCIVTLREEHRLSVFENRVLRRIFGPKRDKVTGGGENFIIRNFVICTHPIFCG